MPKQVLTLASQITPAPAEKPAPKVSKTTAKKTAPKAKKAATKPRPVTPTPDAEGIEVDRPRTDEGRRVALVLSKRDWAMLAEARKVDGVTASERIRTMVAVWRSDDDFAALIDRTARPTTTSRDS